MLTEWLGSECVDSGFVPGTGGIDPASDVAIELGRSDLWPVAPVERKWSEDAIFDFIQFLAQRVSVPDEEGGWFHQHAGCGWHYKQFNAATGRKLFIDKANRILSRYGEGWELRPSLEIVSRAPEGLGSLVTAQLPEHFNGDARHLVHSAIETFRSRKASREDRRNAVRTLGDVFESMRNDVKNYLGKDEADLFNILNNFSIRHSNRTQKSDYDSVWLTGLFYHFLAMIHVLAHLRARAKTT